MNPLVMSNIIHMHRANGRLQLYASDSGVNTSQQGAMSSGLCWTECITVPPRLTHLPSQGHEAHISGG